MKFIDFFAGIGGFRLGMEMAGHECVGHCEIDKFADRSYRAMHDVKEGEWYADDICRVEPGELPEADIWTGGFPCQAFSIAGKRRGFEDMRGTLIFEIFRLAAERKPRILFLENVKGLLNHEGGRTFGIILDGLWELGYDVQWQVLNSKNFGVPQNRERVFIIGHLGGTSTRKVFPIEGTNGETNIPIKQVAHRKGFATNSRTYSPDGITGTLDTAGGGGRELHVAIQPVLTPDRINKRQNGRRMKEPGEEMFTLTAQDRHGIMMTRKEIKGKTETSHCLMARDYKGIGNQEMTAVKEGMRIRKLTPRECFRLQGFPDEYFDRAAAVNSDSQLYKQAGNSVTVNVIYEIAKKLKEEKR